MERGVVKGGEMRMSFGEAISKCLNEYVTFSGRARRSEYWYFFLFNLIASFVASALDMAMNMAVLQVLVALGLLLPSISVTVRRLHDKDKSGWWWWLGLIPIIGWIVLLVWFVQKGTVGANRFGPDPVT